MSVVKVLNPQIANMIAAGEVLERPSSAVKELVENSIDAGADRIIVEIENGGKSLIRVIDNGSGMSEEDAKNCFLRHATSKISKEEDLENILTLGFRGEALASIAAVSEVTLETRTKNSISGTKIVIRAGAITEISETGCNVGTIVTVKDLFFNTPARMKFLKTDLTEAANISEIIEKLIISKPEISFLFIKNGRESMYSAGDNDRFSNLLNIYSKEICDNLTEIDYKTPDIEISGYIGNDRISKSNRKNQTFFVNGRVVKNKVFFSAVDEACKEKIMISKYAFVILDIKIDSGMVDVNVHPTKAEIKFSDDRFMYNHIYNAIYEKLHVKGIEKVSEKEEQTEEITFIKTEEIKEEKSFKLNLSNALKKAEPVKEESYNESFNVISTPKFEALTPKLKEEQTTYVAKEAEKGESNLYKAQTVKDYKIIGQLFSTYVIIEKDDKMYLLDQHAAHERLLFDKIMNDFENKSIVSEALLVPHTVKLTATEAVTVNENIALYESLGFSLEAISGNDIVVREIPFDLDKRDISDTITEIAQMINENKKGMLTYKQERALQTLACKAAIKANMSFSESETEKLVCDVLEKQKANTCPHGRPLFVSFDKKTIEKQFKRS